MQNTLFATQHNGGPPPPSTLRQPWEISDASEMTKSDKTFQYRPHRIMPPRRPIAGPSSQATQRRRPAESESEDESEAEVVPEAQATQSGAKGGLSTAVRSSIGDGVALTLMKQGDQGRRSQACSICLVFGVSPSTYAS